MAIINETSDEIGAAIKIINQCGERMGEEMARNLTIIIETGAPLNPALWSDSRIGAGGVALLAKLAEFVGVLAKHFPEKMNAVLASAGQNLTPNGDGTVTYTAPPPPAPEEPTQEGGE